MKRYPLIAEVTTSLTAPEAFDLIHEHPFSFFLDSGMNHEEMGRYSFIGSDPFLVLKSRGNRITLLSPMGIENKTGNPIDTLAELLEIYKLESHPLSIPFTGGAIGYFSYDLCHFIERLPSTAIDDINLPECCLAFYDLVTAFDHLEGKTYIASSGFPEQNDQKRLLRAAERLEEAKANLAQPHRPVIGPPSTEILSKVDLHSNFTREQYIRAVEATREHIAAGDVFQVNLSQRFEANLSTPPYELYRRLRRINPAPFAAYLNFDEVTVISASPERFLKVQGDRVETRPMKGTRPRGESKAEDKAVALELQNSIKDRSENVMIVDLERNDLGRVCQFGTVKVSELWTLEKYATVFQLTSTVEGRLRHDKNRIDLLKACFPGGSVTGAPKVRAMEIIDKLEPTRRSLYTGSIGYLSFSNQMELNIVIRTILVKDRRIYFQVGGGIVYDSNPEVEYQETLDKAKALFQAINPIPAVLT